MQFEIKYDLRNPAAWRKPWDEVYAHFLDQVVWADEHGFDTVMLHEHHFSDDGYLPSPFTAAAAIAARTKRIRIRLALVLLPLKHPVQVAEDAAVLDIISGGRLEVVVGAGYVPGEFAAYGISIKQRPSRMEEAIEIIKRCWSEDEFSHEGRHWTLHNVRVMPKPLQKPMKLIMGASSPVAAKRAARIADGFMAPSPLFVGPWREEMLALGKDPGPAAAEGTPNPPGNFLHVARDPDAAWKTIGPHALHESNSYATWAAARGGGNYQATEDADVLRASGAYAVMTPSEVVTLGKQIDAGDPRGRLVFHPMMGGMPFALGQESLDLVVNEVMPEFGR